MHILENGKTTRSMVINFKAILNKMIDLRIQGHSSKCTFQWLCLFTQQPKGQDKALIRVDDSPPPAVLTKWT